MIKLYVLFLVSLEGGILYYLTKQTLDCIEFLYEIRKREKRQKRKHLDVKYELDKAESEDKA